MTRSFKNRNGVSKGGFTLVETFVAITILAVAIVGPMTIAARGLQTAFFAKDQIIATYLAQEAMENIRLRRDTQALQNKAAGVTTPWLPVTCTTTEGCGVMRDGSIYSCIAARTCLLRLLNEYYDNSDTGVDTPYTRKAWIRQSGDFAEVTVEVEWFSGVFSNRKSVVLRSYLYNQYPSI